MGVGTDAVVAFVVFNVFVIVDDNVVDDVVAGAYGVVSVVFDGDVMMMMVVLMTVLMSL